MNEVCLGRQCLKAALRVRQEGQAVAAAALGWIEQQPGIICKWKLGGLESGKLQDEVMNGRGRRGGIGGRRQISPSHDCHG